MKSTFAKHWKLIGRTLLAIALVAVTIFGNAHEALARRGGGRIGGGGFKAPTRVAPRPSTGNYYGGGPSYFGGGGGFFFLPLFFGGGGSLFSLLLLLVVAGAVLQVFRGASGQGITGTDSKVTLAKIQVGLLSSAREIQRDLTRLAMEADTDSSQGLSLVMREAAVALLRHPEYWVYVSSAKETTQFAQAEQKFNSLAMSERSKLNAEVLAKVNNRLIQGRSPTATLPSSGELSLEDPSEYIVVTLLVALSGDSMGKLSAIRSSEELRMALQAIGSTSQDSVLALEVLWEPQSDEFTLSADEVLSVYPDLMRI